MSCAALHKATAANKHKVHQLRAYSRVLGVPAAGARLPTRAGVLSPADAAGGCTKQRAASVRTRQGSTKASRGSTCRSVMGGAE